METMVTEDAFKQALEEGEPERVLAALQQGADVAMKIDFGRERLTPLAYCIRKGREDLVALLLEHGAPIREDEAEAYCRALPLRKNTQGTLSMLQLLLEKGLDPAIELRSMMGRRPVLLRIAQHGTVRHLELLCRAGADLTLTDQGGINVLMAAFDGNRRHADIEKIDFIEKQGLRLWHATTQDNDYNLYRFVHNAEAVQLLLDHGVDYNHVDADGLTPLVWAARNQNAAGAELLMRAGALIAPKEASMGERESLFRSFLGLSKPKDRERVGQRFSRCPGYEERQLNEELLNLLFAQTLHAEERGRVCNLALIAACAQKRRDLIDYCLCEGADIHTSTDGFSLLGFVFAQPDFFRVVNKRDKQVEKDLIAYLLERGAELNCRALGVQSVLQTAVASNASPEVVELLMRAGALVAPKEASMGERESLFRSFLGLIKTPLCEGPRYDATQLSEQLISLILAQTLHAEERRRVCNLALIAACAQKRRDLIDYCLSEGADIHTSTDGFSLLGFVFAQPDFFRVVNKRDKQVEKDLIAYLLERGAEINCRAFGVQPVLQTAVVSNASPEVVELLLAHGADKSQAIRTAVSFIKINIEVLKRLLAEPPIDRDWLYKTLLGRTPREIAALRRRGADTVGWLRKLCEQGLIELTENDTDALGIPIASVLKEQQTVAPSTKAEKSGDKGNAHAPQQVILTEEEYEAVEQHIASGDADFIREMLKKYPGFATAELMKQGDDSYYTNRSPLVAAAAAAQPEICRILVESCRDERGIFSFALHRLCSAEDSPAKTETLKLLLEYAQNQQLNVERGLFSWNKRPWSDEHVSLFLEYGSAAVAAERGGATFLHRALYEGKYPLAQQLVRLGCSLDACTDNGYTCLHWACRGGNADCVRLCIEAGLDVHSTIITPRGNKVTPLSLYWKTEALLKERRDGGSRLLPGNPNIGTLELLMQHGISPDWMDHTGTTLLMHAIRTSHSAEMVQMLLQHGADVHQRDREGNTPLMIAVLEQEDEICRLLMEAGASLEDRNNAGCTAMDFARLMQDTQEPGEDEET